MVNDPNIFEVAGVKYRVVGDKLFAYFPPSGSGLHGLGEWGTVGKMRMSRGQLIRPKSIKRPRAPSIKRTSPAVSTPVSKNPIPVVALTQSAAEKFRWASLIPTTGTIDKVADIAGRIMMMRMMMSSGQGAAYGVPMPDSQGIFGQANASPGYGYQVEPISPGGLAYTPAPDTTRLMLIMGGLGLVAFVALR